jgi:hypothetical protein
MSVRIKLWSPGLCVNTLFKAFGDEMLQPLGLVMDFLDRVVEHLLKRGLQKSMMAQDLQRPRPACN